MCGTADAALANSIFPPPLAVNSLHSQDLRATRNERAQHKCVMFPLLAVLQHSAVPFKARVFVLVVCRGFFSESAAA